MKSFILLFFTCFQIFAASVTLKWDKSPDASVIGYRVYSGVTSGSYTNSLLVGNVDSITITNLSIGTKYFFAATARDGIGLESQFSNEVGYTPTNQDTNNYVVLVYELKYGSGLSGTKTTNISLITFTNPPLRQAYSGRLVITNR